MKSPVSRLMKWWTLLLLVVLATQPLLAQKPKLKTASQGCELFPIALSLSSVSNKATGAVLANLRNGSRNGQFGWLTWTGNRSRSALIQSLTSPGDSYRYVNPDKASDTVLSVNDWVKSSESDNHKSVRKALDTLKSRDIVVPVWYQTRGKNNKLAYRVAAFAKVRLISYNLSETDRISVRFLGFVSCDTVNQAPVVSAGPDRTVDHPASASLSGSASDDGLPAGSTLTLAWSKVSGPGTVTFANSAGAITTATFSAPGTYTLRLTGSDTVLSSSDDVQVLVNDPNEAPVANALTLNTDEDVAVNITLTGSDADGDPLTFTVLSNPSFGTLNGTAPNLVYRPAANLSGTDSFTFRVNDGLIDSAAATVTINVAPVNDPPVAYGQSVSTDEDTSVLIALGGNDIEGTALGFAVVTPPANGALSGTPPSLRYTPAHNHSGSDQFTFKVDDGALDSAPATVTLTVRPVNDPPVAYGAQVTLAEDGGADIRLRGTDVEGNALTFSVIVQPAHGTLSGTPPDVRYVPAANFHGSDSFVFKANDGALSSLPAVVNIMVQPVNDAPTAVGNSVTLNEDSAANLVLAGTDVEGSALTFTIVAQPAHGILSGTAPNLQYTPKGNYFGADSFAFRVNDGELDSAPATVSLTVRAINDAPVAVGAEVSLDEDTGADVTLQGSDVEGSSLAFVIVQGPAHGSISGTPPAVRYIPSENYHGPDSFTFKVNDGELDSTAARVTLAVAAVNDPPVAAAQNASTPEDTSLTLSLGATDVDGDSVNCLIVNFPAHGTLSGPPSNVVYTPSPNYFGGDSFQFRANDGTADSELATVSITITPVNDAPAATPQILGTPEDTPANFTLNGTDVEGSALTFRVTRPPAHGTLSGTLPDLAYSPGANFHGSDSLEFAVNDGSLESTPALVVINVSPVNDAPVAHSLMISAIEAESTPITLVGSDVDGDTLTYTIVSGPTNGTFSGAAPNFNYTPNVAGRPEMDSFDFTVSDGVETSPAATVTIDIVYNQPPVVSAGPDRALRSSAEVVTLSGSATDDGLPRNSTLQLSWQLMHGPGTVTFGDAASAVTSASFSANGLYILEFSASDSQYTSRDLVEVRVDLICSANPSGIAAWWQAHYLPTDLVAGNEATLENGVTYGSGKVGAAFVFDGLDDRIRIAPHPSLDLGAGNSFTIEFWMNSANVMRSTRLIGWHSGVDVFSEDQGVNIFQSGGNLHAQIYDTNSLSHEMVAFNVLSNNAWIHLAVTYDRNAGQGRIYINGGLRTTVNLGNFRPRTTFPLFFGNIMPDAGFFEGALDEVAFYTRALDAQEIYEVFAAGDIGKCPLGANLPPLVNAGPDIYLDAPTTAALNGTASDDDLPAPASLRAAWSVVSGPGGVTFANSAALSTTAAFDAAGIYVLRLSVDDAAIVRSDILEVRVSSICTIKNIPGLAGWWPGNGSATDVIASREARLGGGTSFTAGQVGGAFSFDGANDSVRVTGDSALDVGAGAGFSIEFWLHSADVTRNARLLAFHNGLAANGTNVGVNIFQLAGNLHTQIPDPAGATHEFVANGALAANTWTHVAVTYDRTRGLARAYVNGAQRTLANVGSYLPRTLGNLYFGNMPFDANHFRGMLDEVSVYNRTLDGQEVHEIFAAGNVGKCPNDPNQGPIVNAGPDLYLRATADVASLNGSVTDDGLPPGYAVQSLWSVVDGPGAVTFADATAPVTTAAFSAPGIYVLRLMADDALIGASDTMEVRVGSLCTVKDPQGLAAWWPGNGDTRELVGGRHARLANGAALGIGRVSGAFRFDGVNDVVQVPAHPSLDIGQGSDGLTLEFWVNSTDVIRFARVVGWHFGFGSMSTNLGVNVYQQSGGISAQIYDLAGASHEMGAANSLVSNVWTHVAVTYHRTTGQGRIYINGALRTTSNLGIYTPRTSYNLFFGNFPSDATFFRGALDEVSLYNRPLDAQEVYDIYNSGANGKCPKDGNQAPVVNAGSNLELANVSDVANLNGHVTDDGLPNPLRVAWSKLDGPGTVTFTDAGAPATTATFSAPGIYVLSLSADDAAVARNDLVEVRVASTCASAPAGLAAWWPGNASAQEVVGGRDGRLAGGTAFASGRVSAAFSFDGTNDSVHVAAHPSLDVGLGSGLTIEFWINPADVARNGRLVGWHSGLAAGGTNFGVNVQMLGRTISAQIYDLAGAAHDMQAANVLTNNTWTHVSVTYDRAAGQGRIFVNGVQRTVATLGSYTARTSYRLFFGNVPFDPNHFRGLLDEVSIYDRPLASNEVAAVFAAGIGGKCPLAAAAPMFTQHHESAFASASVVQNEHGQRLAMTDASGATTYSYDKQGRLTRLSKSWSAHQGAPAMETTLTYEYDGLGRFAGVHSGNANGASMRYAWNAANHLTEVFDPHSGTTTYHYDAAGRAVSYTYPDGVTGSRFGLVRYEDDGTCVVDADGNPVRRTVGTVTTYYVVSPLSVTGDAMVVEELTYDSSDPRLANAAVTRVYVHGLHTISMEELVAGEWKLSFFE